MTAAVYLVIIILCSSGQNIVKKPFTDKNGGRGVYFFSAAVAFFAMLFFVFSSRSLSFNTALLPYSLGFAVAYCFATVFAILAIAQGPLSLTSLLISYSLMIPTFYGLLFLKDPIGTFFVIGLTLLVISLFLINKKSKDDAKISLKWLLYVVLAFVGNGMCSVIQKMQQSKFDGEYKNEFMIIALAAVFVAMAIGCILREKNDLKKCAKSGWSYALICGSMNGVVNLFVMLLQAKMNVSLMFPLISSGSIIVTYLVSRFFYKEKLTKIQFVGFVTGIAAIVFLNL